MKQHPESIQHIFETKNLDEEHRTIILAYLLSLLANYEEFIDDNRKDLYENNSVLFEGMAARLRKEIKAVAPHSTTKRLHYQKEI